jgi:urease accessory protein
MGTSDFGFVSDLGSQISAFTLWQLADSAFPTGGFAHSNGLEAAVQHGEVRSREELASFLQTSLCQLGNASLPFVTATHREPTRLPELDRLCDTFISSHVANRASRLQGQALLALTQRVFGLPELSRLRNEAPYGHYAPGFGAVAQALGLNRSDAAQLFFFVHLRGFASSAVRLNLIGPLEAQSLQHRLVPQAQTILERCCKLTIDDVAQTAPLLELWQSAQDRLETRLFQS